MKLTDVRVSRERPRGCGFRKPGGLYLVGPELSRSCGKLPLWLHRCPTCGAGILPSRGLTRVNAAKLFEPVACRFVTCETDCGLLKRTDAGLLWVGEQFYSTPRDFLIEAGEVGISRRIKAVPQWFKPGETAVLLAHRKGIPEECDFCRGTGRDDDASQYSSGSPICDECRGEGIRYHPAIFSVFVPTAIEYVCRGDETEDELDRIVKRGLSPVIVEEIAEQADIPF